MSYKKREDKAAGGIRTWAGDILLGIFLVFFEVSREGNRVVNAVLSHLVIDLWWEGHNLFAYCHRGFVWGPRKSSNKASLSVIAKDRRTS